MLQMPPCRLDVSVCLQQSQNLTVHVMALTKIATSTQVLSPHPSHPPDCLLNSAPHGLTGPCCPAMWISGVLGSEKRQLARTAAHVSCDNHQDAALAGVVVGVPCRPRSR
jgi:hypothetical protein